MQFSARLVAFSAAIAQVLAIPQLTNSAYNPVEGQPFTITWTGASGSVTLLLKDGASTDLSTVETIASGLTGTSYTWTPSGLPSDTYAIQITDSTGTNYSPQFTYSGTGTVSATTSATTVSVPTSTGTTSTTVSSTKATTSTISSSTAATTSASNSSSTASTSATGSSNSTTTAKTTLSSSTTKSTSTSSSTSSTSTPSIVNTNDSKKLGSSLAFVVLTAAALLVCN